LGGREGKDGTSLEVSLRFRERWFNGTRLPSVGLMSRAVTAF
ncbi:LOW QUALITY PROTEIN: hypothetical protein PanWU01x14_183290, partial [Parasponia andersonii]